MWPHCEPLGRCRPEHCPTSLPCGSPQVHPSCRILFIDGETGRARLQAQRDDELRQLLREVEVFEWGMGRVYLGALFYTTQAAGMPATAKPRVLTDGRGAPHSFPCSPLFLFFYGRG